MRHNSPPRKLRYRYSVPLIMACLAIFLCGCQREPKLSPGAATFKTEIKNCLHNLTGLLMEPVIKKDKPAIAAALERIESPAVKLCRLCPFQIGVMNSTGETLATYPSKAIEGAQNFSRYELVRKAINSRKIQQQRFFLQDGSELYMICAPLVRNEAVKGLIAIAINSEDAKKRWGFKDKEFLDLNFNT
jgi:hypothetical protein